MSRLRLLGIPLFAAAAACGTHVPPTTARSSVPPVTPVATEVPADAAPPAVTPEPAVPASPVASVLEPAATPAPAPPPAAAVPPQPPVSAVGSRPSDDILKLKQAGFSDDFLLNKIRTENVPYRLTTEEILALRSAGVSETLLSAMLRAGQPQGAVAGTPIARQAEFSGLARVTKGFLGVFGTSTKNVGRLVVDGEKLSWLETEDASKNFSIYVKNVKEVFNTCVLRPGQNLCLEVGFVTYTGEEYRFRDPGWKGGENHLISEATEYFRQAFPQVFFSQRSVSEM